MGREWSILVRLSGMRTIVIMEAGDQVFRSSVTPEAVPLPGAGFGHGRSLRAQPAAIAAAVRSSGGTPEKPDPVAAALAARFTDEPEQAAPARGFRPRQGHIRVRTVAGGSQSVISALMHLALRRGAGGSTAMLSAAQRLRALLRPATGSPAKIPAEAPAARNRRWKLPGPLGRSPALLAGARSIKRRPFPKARSSLPQRCV